MTFAEVLAWVQQYIPTILAVIGAFAVLATFTPNKFDDKIIQFILDFINFLGGNFGKAKNDSTK